MKKELFDQRVIHYKDGVRRFSDNESLYEKYLVKFIKDSHMENASNAFKEKDYQEVLAQIHPLKGMAGTLGMKALYSACDEAVKVLRQQQWQLLEQCMEKVDIEYRLVIELLQQATDE